MTMSALIQMSRSNLLSRKKALLRLSDATGAQQAGALPAAEADWSDNANIASSGALLDGLSAHERRELEEIDAALVRMDDGTWGRCETCGGSIGRQRLIALPEARQCLACRERAETAA